MAEADQVSTSSRWTTLQAYTLAAVCLLLGIVGGWLFRGAKSPAAPPPSAAETAAPQSSSATNAQPTPEQMKAMGDAQARPLLEKLKSTPNDFELLAGIGNIYYDTQQYAIAINYYQQALKVQPENAAVRTDMGTSYWFSGDADTAIEEFKKSLSYDPNRANTLFNLGIVQWQGKMDVEGAIATWQKLLATNPNYVGKDKVLQLIAEAKKHSGVKPGTQAKPLGQ
jgi:cytochrome c-type biogenesis protein CcmH/NrfG